MKHLVEVIACALVEDPTQVKVVEKRDSSVLNLELSVAPADMGKVIGKQGRIAQSLRQVLKACAIKENVKVNLEILESE